MQLTWYRSARCASVLLNSPWLPHWLAGFRISSGTALQASGTCSSHASLFVTGGP